MSSISTCDTHTLKMFIWRSFMVRQKVEAGLTMIAFSLGVLLHAPITHCHGALTRTHLKP